MTVFTASADYDLFKSTVDAIGGVGPVLYWDGTATANAFCAYASVANGLTWVMFSGNSMTEPPASFATDFPGAVPIPGQLSST